MRSLMRRRRRASPRRRHYRMAKIKIGAGILAHDCIVIDMSNSGVRLHVAGFSVPDEFVLFLSVEGVVRESKYKVVGGTAMKLAPSSLASSDLASRCRLVLKLGASPPTSPSCRSCCGGSRGRGSPVLAGARP